MENELKPGDYVLATKYSDGDPQDHWFVGFFVGMLPKVDGDRYEVAWGDGKLARGNGFRRAEKITAKRGQWLLDHQDDIFQGTHSVWWWATQPMRD